MLTKPLHGSQKIDRSDVTGRTICIEVIPNNELYQLLLSFGEDIMVVKPLKIRKEIIQKVKNITNNY